MHNRPNPVSAVSFTIVEAFTVLMVTARSSGATASLNAVHRPAAGRTHADQADQAARSRQQPVQVAKRMCSIVPPGGGVGTIQSVADGVLEQLSGMGRCPDEVRVVEFGLELGATAGMAVIYTAGGAADRQVELAWKNRPKQESRPPLVTAAAGWHMDWR